MANPEHSSIIKTFHGKNTAKDYLGELDDLLKESDDEDTDEEVKRID